MICPRCGTPLASDAHFCTECGLRQDLVPETPYVPGTQYAPGRGPEAGQGARRGSHAGLFVALAVVAALVLGAVVSCGILLGMRGTFLHQTHPVTFSVNFLVDYDSSGSRIPVRITGTDVDGAAVDQTIFLAYSGVDVELLPGSYHAEVVGSPITAQGIIFQIPKETVDFTLGSDLGPGEGYTVPSNLAFTFMPIVPTDVTDEQVKDALDWARKDEASGADVGKLEAAIKKLRETAA